MYQIGVELFFLDYLTVFQAVRRCMYLSSSTDARVRLLVLDVIRHGIEALATCTSELLPAAHLLWKPLVSDVRWMRFAH